MQLLPKTSVVGAAVLEATDDVLLVAQSGRTARITGADLPVIARDRRGSLGMKLDGADLLSRMVILPA
jgi:hypothetical protein